MTRLTPITPPRLGLDALGALGLAGTGLAWLAVAAVVPATVAIGYRESPAPFLLMAVLYAGVGAALRALGRGHSASSLREGYLALAALWLLAAVIGAVPFLLAGESQLDRPVDALFESMSGFSTTGASVLVTVEDLDRSVLIWRQLTQWLGGLGVLVAVLAIIPGLQVDGRVRLEQAGPQRQVEEFSTRIRRRVRRYLGGYVVLTVVLALVLVGFGAGGLDPELTPFTGAALALGTVPGGGFTPWNESVQALAPITHALLVIFMVLAGANLALVVQGLVRGRMRQVLRDEELRIYLGMLVVGTALLTSVLARAGHVEGPGGFGHAAFQAVSVMTSTGFTSIDLGGWPTVALLIVVGMMFVGGCVGSMSGSVKVVRHLLVARQVRREVRYTVQPEVAEPVRLNRSVVDERTLRSVLAFVLIYIGVFAVGTAVLAVDAAVQGPPQQPIQLIAAAAAALGTVGPGLGFSGAGASYAPLSDVSTLTLTCLMWAGRLEVLPVVALLTRTFWRR